MADEGPPPPNIETSISVKARAPIDLMWMLIQDAVLMPKIYDQKCVHDRSLKRDRETRKTTEREVILSNPKCVFRHTTELQEPLEEDIPEPPKEETEEGEEAAAPAPAEEEAAAAESGEGGEGENGEGGEGGSKVAEVVKEKRMRCEAKFELSKLGLNKAEIGDCNGTIIIRCTEPAGGDAIDCDFSVIISLYSETLGDGAIDFTTWATSLTNNFKNYSEKMYYLCPQVLKCKSATYLRTILAKAKKFNFINLKLSRSPSALNLMRAGTVQGSIGFYLDKKSKSPVPIGLNTRAKTAMA